MLEERQLHNDIKIPTMFIRAGADSLVSNDKIEEFYNSLPEDADKVMLTFDEADHLILLDQEFLSMLFGDVTHWLDLRSAATRS